MDTTVQASVRTQNDVTTESYNLVLIVMTQQKKNSLQFNLQYV